MDVANTASEMTERELIVILCEKVDQLQATQDDILLLFAAIKDQVEPLLDKLGNSPILKMLGVK